MKYTLDHTPPGPADSTIAAAIVAPSVVRVDGYLSPEHAAQLEKEEEAEARKRGIKLPADLKGAKFRAAGPTFAGMWEAAGASIVSPPSNEIYNAFQTGVITATDTSLGELLALFRTIGHSRLPAYGETLDERWTVEVLP